MFLFWVNDMAIFPVTQGWHLHTMPALIIVKYNFDYFTPFNYILWQFFSLESKLPQPLFLIFFPLLPGAPYAAVRAWGSGPRGLLSVLQVPLTGSGTSQPPVRLSQLLLTENSCEVATILELTLPVLDSWY